MRERRATLADRVKQHTGDRASDLRHLDELRAAFVGAGGFATEHAPLRVLKAFADAGILKLGQGNAVLVGTHAFNALGNLLGVRWASQMRTHDIDLAGEADVHIAVSHDHPAAPDVLTQLGMGFIPVPALDSRSPSTSFRVRGRELRVDLLTPLVGKPTGKPVFIAALNAPAQPMRFLDYLLKEPIPVVIVGRKASVLVNVPLPERFAFHKLLVSESRPAAFATKAEKDRMQAVQLLQVLIEEAPDGLKQAKTDLVERGKAWSDKLARASKKSQKLAPDAMKYVAEL